MNRASLLTALLVIFFAYGVVLAGETITAKEVESYFYADGEMKRSAGQFEITYYMEGNTITRIRVYDLKRKEFIPDNTVYHIQRQLSSDPSKGLSLLTDQPIIRAIGQPGLDAIEILVLSETFIQAVKSTSDYFVISRLKRIK